MLTPAEREVIENAVGSNLDEYGRALGLTRTHTGAKEPETDEAYRARLLAWSDTPYPKLTDREREVAGQLVMGKKNSEIAEALGISIKTVDTHRGHILQKLEVRNNVELVRLAIRKGWATIEVETEVEVS